MIRFKYQAQLRPPAPFVYVSLRNPLSGSELRDVPAQLDSAADRTVLPDNLAQALSLPQIGKISMGGLGGLVQSLASHPVELTIRDQPAQLVEVVASPGEPWVLLGRDILNIHRLLLDGPQLSLEIG